MSKTILITGATDGIGFETAKALALTGHTLLIHGRNTAKLAATTDTLVSLTKPEQVFSYQADMTELDQVQAMAEQIVKAHKTLDVIINNAGVYKMPDASTRYGIDARFVVNTLAPYLLTERLLPLLAVSGRVVNLSSAAQEPVSLAALQGQPSELEGFSAYAQSKLALTMWTNALAAKVPGKIITSVNPGSLLATKMVREGFGMPGNDISIGQKILVDAALSSTFGDASGRYWDNDIRAFSDPHPSALHGEKTEAVLETVKEILNRLTSRSE